MFKIFKEKNYTHQENSAEISLASLLIILQIDENTLKKKKHYRTNINKTVNEII